MDEREAYAALELPTSAGLADVKTAFRKLSKRYHPDKNSAENHDWAAHHFRQVKEAYQLLVQKEEANEAETRKAQLRELRRLAVGADGTLHESILLQVSPTLWLDVGAWGKEPPFYSRLSLKLSALAPRLEVPVFKSDDFENAGLLKSARALGRLEVVDPPASVTVLTRVDTQGLVRISLLGEHRFLEFDWRTP